MITNSTACTPLPASRGTSCDGPDAPRVIAGIAAAIALQIGAAVAAGFAMLIVVAAAFANFGNYGAERESTWWIVFSVPLAIFAVAIYILSGFTAARLMRTGLGWLTLLAVPALLFVRFAAIAIG